MNLNNCATISEMMFYALHPEEKEIQFDVSFLLDLVPAEKDWIFELMRKV